VVTSHNVILLASGNIERHTSMGLFPLNSYLRVPGYLTNYPIGYPGSKLPGCGSPSVDVGLGMTCRVCDCACEQARAVHWAVARPRLWSDGVWHRQCRRWPGTCACLSLERFLLALCQFVTVFLHQPPLLRSSYYQTSEILYFASDKVSSLQPIGQWIRKFLKWPKWHSFCENHWFYHRESDTFCPVFWSSYDELPHTMAAYPI